MYYNQPTPYGGSFASGLARGLDKVSAAMDSIEATKQNREMLRMRAQQHAQTMQQGDIKLQAMEQELKQMKSKWAGEQFNKALTYYSDAGDPSMLNNAYRNNPELKELFGEFVGFDSPKNFSREALANLGFDDATLDSADFNTRYAIVEGSDGNKYPIDMLALNKTTGNITNLAKFAIEKEQVTQARLDTQGKTLGVEQEQTKSNYRDYELDRIDKAEAAGDVSPEQAARMRDKAIYREKNMSFNQARVENITSNMEVWGKDFDVDFLTTALTNATESDKKVVARKAALKLLQEGQNINSDNPNAKASLQVLMPVMQANNKAVAEYVKRIPLAPIVDKATELMDSLKNNRGIDNNFLSNFISDNLSYLPESFKNVANIKSLEALDTEQRKMLASVASQIIYAKSGKAVSKAELQRIEKSFTSPNKNIKDIATGFMTELKSQRSELERLKSLDPLYFDLYHPNALENINASLRAVDSVLNKGRSPADRTSIDKAGDVMFNSNKTYSDEDRAAFE